MQLSIFIDFHNIFMTLKERGHEVNEAISEIMKMGRRKGEVAEALLFVPIYLFDHGSRGKDKMWDLVNNLALSYGLEVKACPIIRAGIDESGRTKDSVDTCVFAHVIRHVHKDIGPELIVFVTGDGDFLKFGREAENKGKEIEFWSVDPQNTSRIIKSEHNFREIEAEPISFEGNIFMVAITKLLEGTELNDQEKEALKLISRIPNFNLKEDFLEVELLVWLHEKLGIYFDQAQRILEVLIFLKAAEVKPVIKRAVSIDKFHVLFQEIQSRLGKDQDQPI